MEETEKVIIHTIKQCTESLDFIVEQVQGFQTEEGAISSSLIRDALLKGMLDDANNWLGYYYSLSGTVIEGQPDWPDNWVSNC